MPRLLYHCDKGYPADLQEEGKISGNALCLELPVLIFDLFLHDSVGA